MIYRGREGRDFRFFEKKLGKKLPKRSKKNSHNGFSVVLNGGIAKVQKPQIDFLRFLCYNSGMGIDDAFVIQMRNLR